MSTFKRAAERTLEFAVTSTLPARQAALLANGSSCCRDALADTTVLLLQQHAYRGQCNTPEAAMAHMATGSVLPQEALAHWLTTRLGCCVGLLS